MKPGPLLRSAARFVLGRPPRGVVLRTLPAASPAKGREGLRVVSWNVHYGYGPCYDRGSVLGKAEVQRHLRGIVEVVRALDPDLIALQEVDIGAWRSHGIDELAWLQEGLGMPWAAFTSNWDVPWVPIPGFDPRRQWGRVRSGLATLARHPLSGLSRHALPQPPVNGALYNRFYLHRATLETTLELPDGPVRVLNTHTEAFDRTNCDEHGRLLADLTRTAMLPRTLLLGDLNTVPPEATRRHAFEDEPMTDMRGDTAVATLRAVPGLHDLASPERVGAEEAAWFTFPAWKPNRRLDHLFFGDALRPLEARVLRPDPPPSDHEPIFACFAL